MRRISGSTRASPQYSNTTNGRVGAVVSRAGGAGGLVLLIILFWLIFLLNLPWSLDGMAAAAASSEGSSDVVARINKISMIVISAYVIASRWSVTRSVAKRSNVGAIAFLVLAPLSAAWSIDSSATLLRFVSLASVVLVCFAISVSGWNRKRLQQLSVPPVMLILVASLIAGMLYPDRITEVGNDISQKGAWHGIAHAKNEFGMFSSLGVIFCAQSWLAREGRAMTSLVGAAIAFTCLILSRSNTSLFATVVSVATMVLLMRVPIVRRRYSTHVVVGIALTVLLYELVIQNVLPGVNTLLAPVMSLTGKDTTFSARSVIWEVIKAHIQAAPYLGTGYGAYWTGPFPTSPSYVFVDLMYFYPSESHNGYLEVVNDLGLVGLVCLLAFLFWFLRQAIQLMKFDRSQAALYVAILFQEMVMNMSESEFFSRTSIFTVLMLATVCLSRAVLESGVNAYTVGHGGR